MRTAISARSVRTFFLHLSLLLFGVVLETEDVYAAKKQIKENVTAETQVEVADIKSNVMMKSLMVDLKRTLCERGAYFPSCFVVDPQQCSDMVGSSFSVCLKKESAVPAVISRSKSIAVADRVGRCTGEELEKALQPIQPSPKKCKEPRNWF
jgi:hypothetical protein